MTPDQRAKLEEADKNKDLALRNARREVWGKVISKIIDSTNLTVLLKWCKEQSQAQEQRP